MRTQYAEYIELIDGDLFTDTGDREDELPLPTVEFALTSDEFDSALQLSEGLSPYAALQF